MRGIPWWARGQGFCFCIGFLTLAAAAPVASAGVSGVSGLGAWVGQVSEYANPFDPNLDRNASESVITADSTLSVTAGVANVVNRWDNRGSYDMRLQRNGDTSGLPTWSQYVAPNSFPIGTVLTYQGVYSGFTGNMPFAVKAANGNPADWTAVPAIAGSPVNATGPGTPGDDLIRITTPASVITADRLRLDFSSSSIYLTNSYADFNEITVLPDRMVRLVPQSTSASGGAPASTAFNLTGGYAVDGWYDSTAGDKWLKASFGSTQQIDGLVLYSWENIDVNLIITDGAGNPVAAVTMTTGPEGWVLPIKFDHSLLTTDLNFDFGSAAQVGIREIVFLQALAVPEPATASLLGLGACAMLWRRRR